MNDRIQIWAQEGRHGFVDALLRDRKRREAIEFERKYRMRKKK